MRIGLFVWGLYSSKGGTERFTVTLANAMHQRGHSIVLFGQGRPDEDIAPVFPVAEGISSVNLALSDAASIAVAREKLLSQNLDVFCAVYAGDVILWLYPLLHNTGIPLIVSEHGHPHMMDTERWNRYERLGCMAGADAIHMLTEQYRDDLPPELKEKAVVIHNAAAGACAINWEREQNSRKTLLSAGRLLEQDKQFSILIEAFAALAPKFPDWDLHFCGSGPDEDRYRQLAMQCGIENRVVWHGMVDDIEQYYANANIFCLPSRYEGFPLVLLEAQRHCLPCVGFADCGGVNDIIMHGQNGLLAPEMSYQSLAAMLSVVMGKAPLRGALGQNAAQMLSRYDEKNIFDSWENLFRTTAMQKDHTRLVLPPNPEDTLAKNALAEILARSVPMGRPDYLRTQKRDAENNALLHFFQSKMAELTRFKSVHKIGIELSRDLQMFSYPYPVPNPSREVKCVALYIPGLGPGGAERQIVTLAKKLKEQGIDVSVVCNTLEKDCSHYYPLLEEKGIPVYEVYQLQYLEAGKRVLQDRISAISPQWYKTVDRFENFHSLVGALAHIRPDVLHCYLDDANCIGGIAGVLLGIPAIVLSARSVPPGNHETLADLAPWTKIVYSWLLKAPQVRLEANSSAGADEYTRWIGVECKQCYQSFNGIDGTVFSKISTQSRQAARKDLQLPDIAPTVLWVGRHVQVKRPFDMIKVARLVAEKRPDVFFVVAGMHHNATQGIMQAIQENHLDKNVKLFGRVDDMEKVYHAADVLLSTSAVEGFPNGIAEAMLCGLPVVATSAGATTELLNNTANGSLHEVGDIAGMAASILLLLENPALAAKKGRAGRDHVRTHFSPDRLVDHEIALYKTIMGKKRDYTPERFSVEKERPRILLLADNPGWAYDISARQLQKHLADNFSIEIAYVCEKPNLNRYDFDLLHVFWWGETSHLPYVKGPWQVVKEISSHRWQEEGKFGPLTPGEFCDKYLTDAGLVVATSQLLKSLIDPIRPCRLTPNGFDERFTPAKHRYGDLRIGWAGKASDPCKGLNDILLPAAKGVCSLQIASGNLSIPEMVDFYANLDVLCIASTYEGEPLTLLEAMAMGCFPVAVDVGIVPELVRNGENGLIVKRTPQSFRDAFLWCMAHKDQVREAGRYNSELVYKTRTWDKVKGAWRRAWTEALNFQKNT